MTQLMEPRRTDRHRASDPDVAPDLAPESTTAKAPVAVWRRLVPALAISVMVMAYVYATVPFTFAGAVECRQHGFSGAAPAPGTPAGTIIGDVDRRCAEAGNSRMAVAGVTAGLAAVVGLAGAFAPTGAEVRARGAGGVRHDEWARWEVRTLTGAAS